MKKKVNTNIPTIPAEIQKERLRKLFRDFTGENASDITRLKGDASARCIYRLSSGKISIIGIYGPNLAENRAFLGFTNTFRELNLPVPEILTVHPSENYYLLEDLGYITLFDYLTKLRTGKESRFPDIEMIPLYRSVVEYLSRFQIEGAEAVDYNLCYQTKDFDKTAWEIDHDYFLNCFVDIMAPGYQFRKAIEKELGELRILLEPIPGNFFLYRDFQSRNIMLKDGKLHFIDYQSGRKGAVSYDIASLLYDARADIPDDFRKQILIYHCELIGSECGISKDELSEQFNPYALMRILQALGSYGNNGIIKGNSGYLTAIPYALKNIITLLESDSRFAKFPILCDFLKRAQDEKPWEKINILKNQDKSSGCRGGTTCNENIPSN